VDWESRVPVHVLESHWQRDCLESSVRHSLDLIYRYIMLRQKRNDASGRHILHPFIENHFPEMLVGWSSSPA
jgi:hypothetical protein